MLSPTLRLIMRLFLLVLLCSVLTINGIPQGSSSVYLVQSGEIRFASSAELELIEAQSNELRGALDITQNTFAFTVKMSSFSGFNSILQREHFCEKFLECDKFPKASFQGKLIESIDYDKPGTQQIRAKGTLTVHGVTQERIIRGTLQVEQNSILIEANFSVPVEDHHINIPKVVIEHIAKDIVLDIHANLLPANTPSQ